MGWKKLIMGEKMPDKNDPQYKERYEKEVAAGQRFARRLGIDRAAAFVQRSAERWPKLFLGSVFGFVIFCFVLNAYHLVQAARSVSDGRTAVEMQESRYHKKKGLVKPIVNHSKKSDNEHNAAD